MSEKTAGRRLARALGWLSVGLGAPALLAPRAFGRAIGVEPTEGTVKLLRGVGVQELTAAAGLLRQHLPVGWQWSRVAGDASHLALLGRARRSGTGDPERLRTAMRLVAATAVVDTIAGLRLARAASSPPGGRGLQVRRSMTINRPPEEVYRFWRDFSRFPTFMAHVRQVQVEGNGTRSHWVAEGPAGTSFEWDAEVTDDVPGQRIAWRSLPGARIPNRGEVRLVEAPAGQGTEVHVDIRYEPPGGVAGAALAKLFGEEPTQQLADDLRRAKQVLETGAVVRSDGTPEGPLTRRLLKQRPARPDEARG